MGSTVLRKGRMGRERKAMDKKVLKNDQTANKMRMVKKINKPDVYLQGKKTHNSKYATRQKEIMGDNDHNNSMHTPLSFPNPLWQEI